MKLSLENKATTNKRERSKINKINSSRDRISKIIKSSHIVL